MRDLFGLAIPPVLGAIAYFLIIVTLGVMFCWFKEEDAPWWFLLIWAIFTIFIAVLLAAAYIYFFI